MDESYKQYKRKFKRFLDPLIVMLMNRQSDLPEQEWIAFVDRTIVSILNNPKEFLDGELPSKEIIHYCVIEIFKEFVKAKARDSYKQFNFTQDPPTLQLQSLVYSPALK